MDKCNEAIKWLDSNQLAEKEEFEHTLKDVEAVCKPVVTKLHGGAGGMPDAAGGALRGGAGGPTIEEID